MHLKNKITKIKNYFWNSEIIKKKKIKKNIEKEYKKLKSKKKLILIAQQGRSGSRWLINIFKSHKNEFSGATTRDILYESFYHFCSYYKIKVDQKLFFLNLKSRIVEDWKKSKTSVICSPYFVFGLKNVIKEIKPDTIILCITDPIFTANSFLNKNFYNEDFVYSKNLNILGLQQSYYYETSHFFGRVAPKGKNFHKWIKMSRLGKIGWYMNESMKSMFKALKKQSNKEIYLFDLKKSDQNYEFYLSLRKLFKIKWKLSKQHFLNLKKSHEITPPSDLKLNNYDSSKWKKKDKKQFLQQTRFFRNFYKKTNIYLNKSKKII